MKKSIFLISAGIFLLCFAPVSQAAIVYMDYGEHGYILEHEEKETSRFYIKTNSSDLDLAGDETLSINSQHRYNKKTDSESVKVKTKLDVVGTWEGTYKKGYDMAYQLEENVMIGEGSSWRDTFIYTYLFYKTPDDDYLSYWEGMAPGDTGYLGFSFTNSDNTLNYGWAELYIDATYGEVTIFGYAYEDSGQAILTGDTGSPVPVPGAIMLLGSGILGILGFNRRIKE